MGAAYHRDTGLGYCVAMVSPARKRRAWILLLLTWAVIAGVFATRYMANARAERQRFDREAQEQAALRAMDKMAAESPDAEATDPQPGRTADRGLNSAAARAEKGAEPRAAGGSCLRRFTR